MKKCAIIDSQIDLEYIKANRTWLEADFDYSDRTRGTNRNFYSNDGLIFVSYDHAKTFYEIVK